MIQDEALKWITEWLNTNWPSIPATLVLSGIYLKLRSFVGRLKKMESRLKRIMDVCSDQHPDRGKELFKEDGEE